MVAIGEHIRLKREERSAGIHEVKTRQAVLHCNFLRPQVLLHCDWEICTALHRSVICNKDGLMTLNHADARNETGAWRLIVVHAVSRDRAEFEERCVRVQYPIDSFTDEHLAPFFVPLYRGFTATFLNCFELGAEFVYELLHGCQSRHNCKRGITSSVHYFERNR